MAWGEAERWPLLFSSRKGHFTATALRGGETIIDDDTSIGCANDGNLFLLTFDMNEKRNERRDKTEKIKSFTIKQT